MFDKSKYRVIASEKLTIDPQWANSLLSDCLKLTAPNGFFRPSAQYSVFVEVDTIIAGHEHLEAVVSSGVASRLGIAYVEKIDVKPEEAVEDEECFDANVLAAGLESFFSLGHGRGWPANPQDCLQPEKNIEEGELKMIEILSKEDVIIDSSLALVLLNSGDSDDIAVDEDEIVMCDDTREIVGGRELLKEIVESKEPRYVSVVMVKRIVELKTENDKMTIMGEEENKYSIGEFLKEVLAGGAVIAALDSAETTTGRAVCGAIAATAAFGFGEKLPGSVGASMRALALKNCQAATADVMRNGTAVLAPWARQAFQKGLKALQESHDPAAPTVTQEGAGE